MTAQALEPSPETLAKVCDISEQDAELFFSQSSPPPLLRLWAKVCKKLRVRMVWLVAGDSVPQVTGTLGPLDMEALRIAGTLDAKQLRAWLRSGQHMIKS
jgi:hypothetical protein